MLRAPLLCLTLLAPAAFAAAPFAPSGNAGVLARQFALPTVGAPGVLAAGSSAGSAIFDVANEYARLQSATESLEFDGETHRLRLAARRGLGGGWEAGIEIPLLATGGGFLDPWIQGWHDTFGLPNGGREQVPDGAYRYRYLRGLTPALDVRQPDRGLGDVQLSVGRALGDSAALRAMAKLPTGESATLLGGNAGGALWLDLALPMPGRAAAYLSGGVSANARSEVLPDQQARVLPFGGIGLALPLGERTALTAQLFAHGPLYRDSALPALSRAGAPLTIGLAHDFGPAALELGFQEDPSVYASPDFAGYLALSLRP